MVTTRLALAAAIVVGSMAAAQTRPRPDPASHLARVRLIVTSTARTTDVTVEDATLASYTSAILRAPSGSGTTQTGATMRLSNGATGQTAEAQFDAILADVQSGTTVVWNLSAGAGAQTSLEIFSLNDPDRPQLVDRFTPDGASAQFTTDGSRLVSRGSVQVSDVEPRLVVAEYYPWYASLDTWRDPQFADRPLLPYSSDDPDAVNRQAAEAKTAGVDAFAVSWQGPANVEVDRRTRLVLDAAARAGINGSVYFESYVANPNSDPNAPADPDTMVRWLEATIDRYASHPAYLRVNNRPVIFAYAASVLSESQWKRVIATVRATGRDFLLVGEFFHSRLLNVLDGEYQYFNLVLPLAKRLTDFHVETLRVRTFDLLPANGRRRIWMANVSPGYDDRQLSARPTHIFIDREDGAAYDAEWRAALAAAPDWIMISTWNEYFENTEIEASARYGTRFVDATRRWAAEFKRSDDPSDRRSTPLP
jgi:Glycosyl hydrolase family 99